MSGEASCGMGYSKFSVDIGLRERLGFIHAEKYISRYPPPVPMCATHTMIGRVCTIQTARQAKRVCHSGLGHAFKPHPLSVTIYRSRGLKEPPSHRHLLQQCEPSLPCLLKLHIAIFATGNSACSVKDTRIGSLRIRQHTIGQLTHRSSCIRSIPPSRSFYS